MESKRFVKNDSGFVCQNCGATVEPLGSSSRNHCPFCLWSRHLDIMPGDRAADCGGMMEPVRVETDAKRGLMILHRCTKCGYIGRNRAVPDAKVQPDSMDELIRLTVAEL